MLTFLTILAMIGLGLLAMFVIALMILFAYCVEHWLDSHPYLPPYDNKGDYDV